MTHLLSTTRLRAWLCALFAVAAVFGCGGGVDSGGTGAAIQSYSAGRISGFGSVIVNGVRFEDSSATIVDEDGVSHPASDLKLGMQIEVDAGAITADPVSGEKSGVAQRVQFGNAIQGPLEAVDAANRVLTVLGQAVSVDDATVFDDALPGGMADLSLGDLLVVHAFLDSGSGTYTATRISRVASLADYRLRGVVSQLDTASRTFSIGTANISYAGVVAVDAAMLADGAIARVRLKTTPINGVWQLVQAAIAGRHVFADHTVVEIEGVVSAFKDTSNFKLEGQPVDASGAGVSFSGGSATDLRNGVRVQVDGDIVGGTLQAQSVDIMTTVAQDRKVNLHGEITSLDVASKTFILRGSTVVFDAATVFKKGVSGDLAAGTVVHVKGQLVDNGTRVYAAEIQF